jgi:zinc/manganese transport system permease protein
MSLEYLDWSILGPALLAGLLVIATHVPLGKEVLRRGIVFLDLAVAQLAGLAVILVHVVWHDPGNWMVQGVAFVVACAGAMLLRLTEHLEINLQEALIGVVFVTASSLGILLLANDPHGGEQLRDLLVGQILWVEFGDLALVALAYLIVLLVWFLPGRPASGVLFYLLFGFTITVSVQLVGVYLVFASLIIPALATVSLKGTAGLLAAYVMALFAYLAGLIASAMLDLPSGAVIVISLAVFGLATGIMLDRRNRAG